jgi:regulator of RNase E activity RraB
MTFPDDDNGDVLRRMFEGGDSLTRAREIEFAHQFSDAQAAEAFSFEVAGPGIEVNVDEVDDRPGTPWDVIVTVTMIPDHAAISELEERFGGLAERMGGAADGWGCFRIADRTVIG